MKQAPEEVAGTSLKNKIDGKELIELLERPQLEELIINEKLPIITTKTKIWQIWLSTCVSLTCFPYGLMLGWPSPIHPKLLAINSPLSITMDQTAITIGFLLVGLIFGTLLSFIHIDIIGPKTGIILSNLLITIGWILMWQATDIIWILASRFILGTGQGYVVQFIKVYIQEISMTPLSEFLMKLVPFYWRVGFVVAYAIGPFVSFREFSLICLIIATVILFLLLFAPPTPTELIRAEKIDDAKKLLSFVKPNQQIDEYCKTLSHNCTVKNNTSSQIFAKIIRNNPLKIKLIKLTIICFGQQFSGVPPTLAYTQIFFRECHVPYPEYFAFIYAMLFLFSSILAYHLVPKCNSKVLIFISNFAVIILHLCNIYFIYFKLFLTFPYISVIIMYLFLIVHTVGLGSVPFALINIWFPVECRLFMTKYFTVVHSTFAIVITKIFQLLFEHYGLYVPFYLFIAASVFSIIFISIFMEYNNNSTSK